ncbi:MAG: SRPBCC family protein [Kiloniellaceae bacterium]
MSTVAEESSTAGRELTLTRLIAVPREKVYRAWTEPELLKRWFAPSPYTTPHAELDVRSGGSNFIVMRDPDGNDMPLRGVYLEVVKNELIVFTDAFTEAWLPSEKPFFTGIITFEDEDGKTRYTARARHWSEAGCKAHEDMGFHEGWGLCAEQLAAVAAKL